MVVDGLHPHLAVADLAGAAALDDRVDDEVGAVVVDDHLDLHLRDEVDLVLRAAVGLGVAALRPKPRTSVMVIPTTPAWVRADFTSSSLNGFTMAVTIFISAGPSRGRRRVRGLAVLDESSPMFSSSSVT
jgi:hypothetical protein